MAGEKGIVMAIFCTKCGTSNEDGAGFCDNCGAPLRAASAKTPDVDVTSQPPNATGRTVSPSPVTNINRKKIIYAAAGLAIVLVLGCGAMYFILQPPAATASTLLAAAKAGYGKETTDKLKGELCISNLNYKTKTLNIGQNDQGTLEWMNALVTAGLYSPPVAVSSGGYFAQALQQYVATPELEKYREGNRLCAAKDVEVADVIDIEKPEEQSIGSNGGPPKVMAVKTKLIFRSVNTAPWMDLPDVREAVMTNVNGWVYKDKTFQKKTADSFELRDSKWTTGEAYKAELKKQYFMSQRSGKNTGDGASKDSAKSSTSSLNSTLSNLFSTGHPLKGTWRNTNEGEMKMIAEFGAPGPGGIKVTKKMTFTPDSIETDGQSVKCKFETNGKRIKVTPEGQSISLIFNMEDDGSMSVVVDSIGTFRFVKIE